MDFGLIPLPFGWSEVSDLARAHRYAWTFGILFNLMAMFWCVAIADNLQTQARRDRAEANDRRYFIAKIWFGGGMLLIPAILLYPILGLYMLIPVVLALLAVPVLETLAGLAYVGVLAGLLIINKIYCTVRTIKNPDWH